MNERDPALEKAWRAHSRETPPPALDAAILAAAHRAVDSKPRAATSAPKWWMPLMAAAAIGAVAIGVVQLAPPEPPGLDTGSSSVVATVEDKRAPPPAAAPPADAPKALERKPDADQEALKSAPPPEARAKKQKESADTNAAAPAPTSRVAGNVVEAGRDVAPPAKLATAPVPPPPPAQEAPRENKLAAQRRPEPFPASPQAQTAESAALGARGGQGFADGITPGAKRELKEEARKDAPATERQLAAAAPPPPAAAPAPAGVAEPRPEQPMRMMESDRARMQASGALQKNVGKAKEAESASEKARDPDAWIARIRKLRDDGQTADALRELREFRDNVPDAEKRLPPDLRDWKP